MPRYWVDWTDSSFPQIRPEEDATGYEDMVSFAEAKQKIVNHFQNRIKFAREMIADTRALRVRDVKRKEES